MIMIKEMIQLSTVFFTIVILPKSQISLEIFNFLCISGSVQG